MVFARNAEAEILVPDFTAWALVNGVYLLGNWVYLVDKRDTEALAFAFSEVPDVVLGACLDVAGALASFCVPVVGVVDASLWSANPVALFSVPGVHSSVSGVRGFEGADAVVLSLVPVIVLGADSDGLELAVI